MRVGLLGGAPTAPPSARWPRAYRPLRPVSLLLQVLGLVAAEVLLFQAYSVHDSRFHWATHFLVGLLAAAVWRTGFLLVAARPAPLQVLSVVGFHLLAMWPDLAFRGGVPHERWMDWVALGHISAHYLPGGDDTWLVLALAGSGGYVLLLSRWLAARGAEARLGLAPALGMGGSSVWRAQRDPRTTVLAHRHHPPPARGPGAHVVLLHGLGGTAAVWEAVAALLARHGTEATAVDLLGFGASRRIGTVFGLPEQAAALLLLLDRHSPDRPVHLVAHSWGAAVAAHAVRQAPDRIDRLTLVTPAVFADVDRARERFAGRSWLARRTVAGSPVADLVCSLMCLLRPALHRLAPLAGRDVPPDVARGALAHSYPAYRDALHGLMDDRVLRDLVVDPPLPVTLVLADEDSTVPPADVLALGPAPTVRVVVLHGTHLLPLEDPARVAALVQDGAPGTPPPAAR